MSLTHCATNADNKFTRLFPVFLFVAKGSFVPIDHKMPLTTFVAIVSFSTTLLHPRQRKLKTIKNITSQ